jgi:hypothetical protein
MEIEDRLTTMEKRLHNQEKRLRYHRITVGILVLFIMLMVGTRVGANSGELTCTKLRVVDAEGNVQVALGGDALGGGLVTYSPEEKLLVQLGSMSGNGMVSTHSPEEEMQVVMTSTTRGGGIATYSPEGKELVQLSATTYGEGGVWTTTKSGRKKRLD